MSTKATAVQIPVNTCACGCGLPITTKAMFKPGHDAKAVSNLLAELTNTIQDGGTITKQMIASSAKTLPSEPLRNKFLRAADKLVAKVTASSTDAKGQAK